MILMVTVGSFRSSAAHGKSGAVKISPESSEILLNGSAHWLCFSGPDSGERADFALGRVPAQDVSVHLRRRRRSLIPRRRNNPAVHHEAPSALVTGSTISCYRDNKQSRRSDCPR